MIVNFSVQNFGPIKEMQTLTFEAEHKERMEDTYISTVAGKRLLKLGLIFGPNASGKTTVINALHFLRKLVIEPENQKNEKLDFKPFLFDELTPDESTVFELEFVQNEKRYLYNVELTTEAIVSEELYVYPYKVNIFKRSTDLKKQLTKIQIGNKFSKDKAVEKQLAANTLWNNTVLGGFLKTNIEFDELKEVTEWFGNTLKPIVYSTTDFESYVTAEIDKGAVDKKLIVDIIKQADFNISDIIVKKETKELTDDLIEMVKKIPSLPEEEKRRIEKEKNLTAVSVEFEHTVNDAVYRLPIDLESEGTKRYYGFARLLALLISENTVLPIDELEASLHPDLYKHFLLSYLMNAGESQLIATTHNREVLNNRDLFRDDVIWFTEKDENAAAQLYSLADFDSSAVRDTNNVLNAYKAGRLGAIPNLSNYYIKNIE